MITDFGSNDHVPNDYLEDYPMKLYLVQHGEALSKAQNPERPLSEQGQSDMERLAAFLAGDIQVSRVIHSGKERALQTANILAAALSSGAGVEAVDGINPKDPTGPFAQDISNFDGDTLVVGHLPFMAKLTNRLVTGSEDTAVAAFRPGSVVCLESVEPGDWQIQWMLRPELLRNR